MGYHVLVKARAAVAAMMVPGADEYDPSYPALSFLKQRNEEKQYRGMAVGMKALFWRYAADGVLHAELFHYANREEKIYEFIKGDLRILCFHVEGGVILTNGYVKHGQKADKNAVATAVNMRDKFEARSI